MSRAPKEIRTKRHRSGRYLVGYLEEPGVWHQSPEEEAPRALAWAKRNRARLLTAPTAALTLRPFLEGFFLPSGAWVTRIRAKGQAISDRHLANYEGQARNYLIPLFGDEDPRQLSARQIDDVILAATAKGGRALASATKYKILHAFSLFLADAGLRVDESLRNQSKRNADDVRLGKGLISPKFRRLPPRRSPAGGSRRLGWRPRSGQRRNAPGRALPGAGGRRRGQGAARIGPRPRRATRPSRSGLGQWLRRRPPVEGPYATATRKLSFRSCE